jgi:DNA-binding NarL/FixJ family response regulator
MASHTQNLRNHRANGITNSNQTTSILSTPIFSKDEWAQIFDELSLSPRQTEIVECLFLAESDKQIAVDLGITVPTVRTHLSRLFLKLDVQDRQELILYIIHIFHENSRANSRSSSQ